MLLKVNEESIPSMFSPTKDDLFSASMGMRFVRLGSEPAFHRCECMT